MKVRIVPKKLCGTVEAVSSKSDAHRKIIASALADRPTRIGINNFSDDIDATLECIEALGGGWQKNGNSVLITPIKPREGTASLDFRESGSTARFLLPVTAALSENGEYRGRGRLPERPFEELTTQLRLHDVAVDSDKLPMRTSGKLKSGEYRISGSISSQYLTGLLFALPLLEGDSRIVLTSSLNSSAYVDMTLDTLSQFGVNIEVRGNEYVIKSQKYISPGELTAEGDWSGAAFWVAADKICGGVNINGMNFASRQGDMQIMSLLDATDIDASQIPDLVPILAVLAASRNARTVIRGAERLRLKESDRLLAMTECINSLGGKAEETDDGIIIYGTGRLKGGRVDGFGDHRVVMSAAIASCICENEVEIDGAEAVKKSYPSFFEDFAALGGVFDVSDR
ncbi:MAG: 3-phosphoshikimate 1-carboxyvinyltransferase [Clostridia bacterium]|nr:3-phosphoshikimate 1-carboxyvinyltransferase [Clostridia bacterium]